MKNIIDRRSIPQGTIHRSGRVENGSSVLDTQAPAKAFQVGLRTVAIAITLAALCLAWPLPVRAADVTLVTQSVPPAVITASTELQDAITTFAADPSAANRAAINAALTAYNKAVADAALNVFDTSTTAVVPVSVPSGQALVILATGPNGRLAFPGSSPGTTLILNNSGPFPRH
jgi:hypothetical protein